MKPLKEKLLIKDATIPKIQFDNEWFFKPDDKAFTFKKIYLRLNLYFCQ